MRNSARNPRSVLIALALSLLPVGALTGLATAGPTPSSKLCEIKTTPQAGGISLEAVVKADRSLSGTYTLRIEQTAGSGSSSITQGGAFEVSGDQETTLSSVTLASRGSSYQAVLEVTSDGKSDRCVKLLRVP
ncbi:MAG: hypothetical protein ABS35_13730 [Kaistia sp. SCN 65-12]|nr:MAG: hypothetical protein ABS35_13730 [Kaistia sp. SCN 65-12]